MISVSIDSYRQCQNFSLKLNYGNMILIEGPSGSGKTTLIEAIRWVLFGHIAHIQDIFSTKRSCVKLDINDLSMTRTTRPHSLTVFKNNIEYTGDSAQSLVNEIFGTKDIFELSSYMRQDDVPCPMLSASNNVRLHYLTQLCFLDEDTPPDNILSAVYDAMKELENKYNDALTHYERQLTDFSNIITTHPLNPDLKIYIAKHGPDNAMILLNNQLTKYIDLNNQYKIEIVRSEAAELELSRLINEQDFLTTQLTNIISSANINGDSNINVFKSNIVNIEDKISVLSDTIVSINTKRDELQIIHAKHSTIIKQQHDKKILLEELSNINNILPPSSNVFTQRDLYKLEAEIRQYNTNHSLLSTCTCSYPTINCSLDTLQNSLTNLKNDLIAADIHICPNCNVNLCYTNDKFVISDIDHKDVDVNNIKKDIDTITRVIHNYIEKPNLTLDTAKLIVRQTELTNLLNTYSDESKDDSGRYSLEYADLSPNDINDMLNNLTTLRSNHINEIEQLRKQVNIIRTTISKLESDKVAKLSTKLELDNQLKRIETRITDIKKIAYTRTEEELTFAEIEVQNIKTQIEEASHIITMTNKRSDLEIMRNNLTNMMTTLKDLMGLYNTAFNTYYDKLSEIVARINHALHERSEFLFDFPLTVQLGLEKKMKKSGRLKPDIAFNVIYKGKECNPFYHLSYGQRKRLSLLLSMAINTLTKSPIVLYDEILTNVDLPTRERCIKVIRETLRDDRVIICAELHGDEREYDEIIKLD